jgi:phosphatidylglycerophosphate synthase
VTRLVLQAEIVTGMNAIRPVPFPVLLLLLGFAGLIGWLRYYGLTRGSAPSSKKARWLTFGILLAIFLLIVGVNAFLNSRPGLPQF